jgi:hypothetical protein
MAGDVCADDVQCTGTGSPNKLALAALLRPAAIAHSRPHAVVPEDAKLGLAAFSADANPHNFCAGRMADALTFVSFRPKSRGRRTNRMKAVQRREKSDLRQRQAIGFHAS